MCVCVVCVWVGGLDWKNVEVFLFINHLSSNVVLQVCTCRCDLLVLVDLNEYRVDVIYLYIWPYIINECSIYFYF